MLEEIVLPALGESVTEGTVTRWFKKPGDLIKADEALLEVSTDKVDTEVPSPIDGVIQEILVEENATVAVGTVLARINTDVSAAATTPPSAPQTPPKEQTEPPATSAAPPAEPTLDHFGTLGSQSSAPLSPQHQPAPHISSSAPDDSGGISATREAGVSGDTTSAQDALSQPYITPIVRQMATDRGIDLNTIRGTGTGGRIRKEDILAAQIPANTTPNTNFAAQKLSPEQLTPSALRGTSQPLSRLRKIISERAVESMSTTAQLTTVIEVDVTSISRIRAAKKDAFFEKFGTKLTLLSFFTKAATDALKVYPIINSHLAQDEIVYPEYENISLAVDTPKGLITPVIKRAGELSVREIAQKISDLAQRARESALLPDDLSGGTFTITNTGSRGALFDTPVVFLPQEAILGIGSVVKRPWVMTLPDGTQTIAIRDLVYLALSYDHRLIDGADAARFLTLTKQILESASFDLDF